MTEELEGPIRMEVNNSHCYSNTMCTKPYKANHTDSPLMSAAARKAALARGNC